MNPLSLDNLKKWYKNHYEKTLADFFTFLRFASISTDPKYAKETRRTAEWLCAYLKEMGMQAELWETIGFPVVFATNGPPKKNRPTVLIYHHYDVQPVDPLELWHTKPFEPAVRDGQVFARGASDNKGQCFYSLTALKACLELARDLDCNIKVFIEGEEEVGGRGTAAALREKEKELKADHLLVVDFGIPDSATPAITLGMRGIVTLDVRLSNSAMDLHSGVHGGIALNPNRALATLLASMWDEKGKVTIPHFYDDIHSFSEKDLEKIDLSFDQERYEKDFGVHAYSMQEGYTPITSNWLRPSLEINGMSGGYTGVGFKTVIPAKAEAKISCRLVPHQDPEKVGKAISEYLRRNTPKGLKVEVDIHHGDSAYHSSIDSFIVKTASLAYEEVFGKPCKYWLCGASVPIVGDLARISKADVAMIGVALDDDEIHAPNEHMGLDRLEMGYLTMACILDRLCRT